METSERAATGCAPVASTHSESLTKLNSNLVMSSRSWLVSILAEGARPRHVHTPCGAIVRTSPRCLGPSRLVLAAEFHKFSQDMNVVKLMLDTARNQ